MVKRIEDLFQLLNLWQQYIDIIYAPEAEIMAMKQLKEHGLYSSVMEGMTNEEMGFAQKMQQEETEKKLAQLFDRDEQLEEQETNE